MCLIYYRDNDKHAPPDYAALEEAFYVNPDGVGMAWYADEWRVWRGVGAEWPSVAKRLRALHAERVVVHFRFATRGDCELGNCHPFEVAPQSFLFHNGTFPIDGDESDTRQVAENMSTIVANGGRLVDAWRLVKLLSDPNRLLLTLPGGKVARAGRWIRRSDGYYSNAQCLYADRCFADWFRDFA
jgi:hypothetical protein